jgi:hypothetical protein
MGFTYEWVNAIDGECKVKIIPTGWNKDKPFIVDLKEVASIYSDIKKNDTDVSDDDMLFDTFEMFYNDEVS